MPNCTWRDRSPASSGWRIVGDNGGRDLRGYVEGQHAWRVAPGYAGRFVADDPTVASMPVLLREVADIASEEIDSPYLVSTHGGSIAVNVTDKGAAVPTASQHKVRLVPAAAGESSLPDHMAIRGIVTLDAQGESFFAKVSRQVLRVLWREGGL